VRGLLILLIWAVPAAAHEYHASLTRIEHNLETGQLEIVVRVFSNDLERGLQKHTQRRVVLDTEPEIEKLTLAYLEERFQVGEDATSPAPLTWVGMEIEVDVTWLYLTAPHPAGKPLVVTNRLFFDLEPTQINTVNLKTPAGRASAALRPGDKTATLVPEAE